jgi:hypothetical protein
MNETQNARSRPWTNRPFTDTPRYLNWARYFAVGLGIWAFSEGADLIYPGALYCDFPFTRFNLLETDRPVVDIVINSILFSALFSIIAAFSISIFDRCREGSERFPKFIEIGYKAAMIRNGTYTFEVADDGLMIHPLGYSYRLFDCCPKPLSYGPISIQSSDNQKFSAKIGAVIVKDDIFKAMRVEDSEAELLQSTLRTALSNALVGSTALGIIENKANIRDTSFDWINSRLQQYGFRADSVDIEAHILEVPEQLYLQRLAFAKLTESHPEFDKGRLVDFILANKGYLTKHVKETKHSHSIEGAGLDSLLKAAAEYIGQTPK